MMRESGSSPTTALARYVFELRVEDIPASVRNHAALLIMDTLGAGLYGAAGPAARLVYEEARTRYRSGSAAIWGRATALDAAGAALVNGTQAHEFELDDYVPSAKLHPGAVILPACLAVADDDVSGAELITTLVAAYEVMIRVSLAADAAATRRRGWHTTGLAGPFGAAAAAGRLMGLDVDALVRAFGIAGSCSSGLFAFSHEGSMTKCLHAGRGAEAGVTAARLASSGFTGPSHVLDAEDGGLLWAISDAARLEPLTEGLGQDFKLADAAIKPYPCCGSIHSSIDAVLSLRAKHGLDPVDIVEIRVANSSDVLRQCGFSYCGDGGVLEARMSLQYCLAAAALDGAVGLQQFEERRRTDPAIRRLIDRVTFTVDPDIDAMYPHQYAARVIICMRSGASVEEYVPTPLGTPQNPMSLSQVESKFLRAGQSATGVDREATRKLLRDLEQLVSVVPLQHALAASSELASDRQQSKELKRVAP